MNRNTNPLGTPSACSEAKQDVQKPRGWYRRLLPHCDQPGLMQFITYRLADSIPSAILTEIENELRVIPPEHMAVERRRKIESMLDQGHGSGVLREPLAAKCIIENWQHFHGTRYTLLAWVVMPTHVHVLIQLFEEVSLPNVVQSWKSYTGKRLKALFPHACVAGEFWIRESWDRYIRDEKHFLVTLDYIRQNPVKAKLVTTPEEWPYTGTTLLGPPSACSEISEVLKHPITEQALGAPRPPGTPKPLGTPKLPGTPRPLGTPKPLGAPSACSEQRQTSTNIANVAGILEG